MREDIKIKTNDLNFKFRVAGIFIRDNKLLVVSAYNDDFVCLPGGYVELGENTEDAILREMQEEVGKKFKIDKYAGVVENFFLNKNGKKMHEISFYYLVDACEEVPSYDFDIVENDKGYVIEQHFKWVDLSCLDNVNLMPAFLKEVLNENKIEFKHMIVSN